MEWLASLSRKQCSLDVIVDVDTGEALYIVVGGCDATFFSFYIGEKSPFLCCAWIFLHHHHHDDCSALKFGKTNS